MYGLLLIRVLLSVAGNALQKRMVLRAVPVLPLWLITYGIMLIPGIGLAFTKPWPASGAFWWNIALGGCLDAVGNLAMVAALRATDLSIFGPLNAFRPVLALLFGWVFLRESPSAIGMMGIFITAGGAAMLLRGDRGGTSLTRRQAARILALRFTGIACSAVGAVFLKRAAMLGSAETTLAAWIFCGLLFLTFGTWNQRSDWASIQLQAEKETLVVHALAFFIMQLATLYVFQKVILAYSFAYFQLGMVLQVLVGAYVFRERGLGWRLAACLVMCVGAGLLAWRG